MKSHNLKWMIGGVFALALLGGAAAGMLAARYSLGRAQGFSAQDTSLSRQLRLSPAQQTEIRQVWEQMRGKADDCYRTARRLDQERDDGIIGLLTDQQKKQYEKIYQDYRDQYTRNTAQREAAFDAAVSRTKQFLSDWQRQRYDQILAQRMGTGPASPPDRPADSRAVGASGNSSSFSPAPPSSD